MRATWTIPSGLHFCACALRRIIEEGFLGDALTFPALVGQFFHVGGSAVLPLEIEYPADNHPVAVDEHRPHALRRQRSRFREHPAFIFHVRRTPYAWRGLVLLHGSIDGVELFDGFDMGIPLDASDESFEGFGGWHGLPVAHDDADLRYHTVAHFAHHQIELAEADIIADIRAAAELAVDVLRERHGADRLRHGAAVHFDDFAQRRVAI